MEFDYPVPSHFLYSGQDGSGTRILSDPGPEQLKVMCVVRKKLELVGSCHSYIQERSQRG